jgi:hypothetical protein
LIKLDIINEVVSKTGITKTKAEMAVETVFESMKKALGQGDRIELRGLPQDRRRSFHPPGKSGKVQTRQGVAGFAIRGCRMSDFRCRLPAP